VNRRVAAVIPTYQGRELLARFLPHVLRALSLHGVRVTVVDDGSTDGTAEMLAARFPSVRVLRAEVNLGFARAVNRGVQETEAEILLLLNSDVAPEADFLPPLVEAFDEAELFAAVPAVLKPDGVCESVVAGEFRRGLFRLVFQPERYRRGRVDSLPVLYAVGAAAAFRREKFLALGGFDPLYAPYYWEDADLGYRAWKQGFTVRCVPASRVLHYGSATIGSEPRGRVAFVQSRNRFLFMWKNLDALWLGQHFLWLPAHLTVSLFTGRALFTFSCLSALLHLPHALLRRQAPTRSDREVLARFPRVAARDPEQMARREEP